MEKKMTVIITEVWNYNGKSKKLAEIETGYGYLAMDDAVRAWISLNRPELTCAFSAIDHGYHAIEKLV